MGFADSEAISVTKPYYALKEPTVVDPGSVRARVFTETKHTEASPMSAAEAGRHLAILGSLGLASLLKSDSRQYFLATEATLEASPHNIVTTHDVRQGFSCSAKVKKLERRNGLVEAILSSNEVHSLWLFNFTIDYIIINARTFEKLHAEHRATPRRLNFKDPYRKEQRLRSLRFDGKHASASYGVVMPSDCAGHFLNFPVLPIARLGGAMVQLAASHANRSSGRVRRYIVEQAKLRAHALAFAGMPVNFSCYIIEEFADRTHLHCVAYGESQFYLYGELDVQLASIG